VSLQAWVLTKCERPTFALSALVSMYCNYLTPVLAQNKNTAHYEVNRWYWPLRVFHAMPYLVKQCLFNPDSPYKKSKNKINTLKMPLHQVSISAIPITYVQKIKTWHYRSEENLICKMMQSFVTYNLLCITLRSTSLYWICRWKDIKI